MSGTGRNPLPPETAFTGVSIDSRRVREGDLFVALPGARVDGHDFVQEALRRGAQAALVEERWLKQQPRRRVRGLALLPVPDTLEALQSLARYHRRRLEIPIVAVTGSNGKTTTKEMIAAVLATHLRTLRNEHSYNNHIGVPLTLLRLRRAHEAAVLEMGMNHAGEISRLCALAEPTAGVITNVGPVHMAYFESLEEVARAKGELAESLGPEGFLVLNADDPLAWGLRERTSARVIGFGFQPEAEVRGTWLPPQRGVYARLLIEGEQITLRVPGAHNAANALAAAAVGLAMACTPAQIREGLESYGGIRWRLEPVPIGEVLVLNDAYNANPVSAMIALEALRDWQNGRPHRRVAVLGDMLELGAIAEREHHALGEGAGRGGVALLVAVGTWASVVAEGARQAGMSTEGVCTATDAEQAWQLLAPRLVPGDLVLLKGSRGMGLEVLVDRLREDHDAASSIAGGEN